MLAAFVSLLISIWFTSYVITNVNKLGDGAFKEWREWN
jgi:hypothetical protein